MLKARRATTHVPIQARRVPRTHLLDDVRNDLRRYVRRVSQEHPEEPHCAQLQREPGSVAVAAAPGDQPLVSIVKKEEALQLRSRRRAYETAVRRLSLAARLRDHDAAR